MKEFLGKPDGALYGLLMERWEIPPKCFMKFLACPGANSGATINDIPYVREVLAKKARSRWRARCGSEPG